MMSKGSCSHPALFSMLLLAGGRSSRFGSDKSMLRINGTLMVQTVMDRLRGLFYQTLIATDFPGKFTLPDVLEVTDEFPGKGPLGGVHAGLKACGTPWVFVLACDMPAIRRDVVEALLHEASKTDAQAVIPQHGGMYEPLCAMYRRDIAGTIEEMLRTEQNKKQPGMMTLIDRLDAKYFQAENCFLNVNTPEDLKKAHETLGI